MLELCGSRNRQQSPYPFKRSAQTRYGPQKTGEVREEVQEIKDEWEDEEVEGNGGPKVEGETLIKCVDEMTCVTPLSYSMQCES